MVRRSKPTLDTRPSWRDPNLPVVRNYRFGNGKTMTEVDPDYERRYREHMIDMSENPTYKNDTTYNLRRSKP